mgnify:CR=1 FL=1
MKLNKNLKAILCLCLALLFSFSAVFFAGCDKNKGNTGGGSGGNGGGEIQRTFFENYVSGFAAVYANSENGDYSGIQASQDKTSDMLGKIKDGLIFNYGSGNDDTYRYSVNAPFYDSIRMLVTNDNETATANLNKHWNWSFDFATSNHTNQLNHIKPKDNINPKEQYNDWILRITGQNSSSKSYEKLDLSMYTLPEYMSDILQIVLYQTMIGYSELYKLEITFESVSTFTFKNGNKTTTIENGKVYTVKLKNTNTILFQSITYEDDGDYATDIVKYYKPKAESVANLKSYPYTYIKEYLYGEGGTKDNPTGGLAKEYLEKSRYVGLTKQNADKLIDYILTEIVGKDLVLYDYDNYKNQPVNFRNYVETIAYLVYAQTYDGSNEDWVYTFPSGNSAKITYTFDQGQRNSAKTKGLLNESERGSFSAKPATYVKYFPGESFFGDPNSTNQFAGKPYAEYQSIVINPAISEETTKDGGIKLEAGFGFKFMSRNKNLRIIPKIRYCVYNEETGTQYFYEFDADEINFNGAKSFVNAAGQTCYENNFNFGVDVSKLDPSLVKTQVDSSGHKETTYTVGFFQNKELLNSVVAETRLTEKAGVQDFYKVVESKNGHGGTTVLNENHIKSSFFEIVFDIVKSETDPEGTDYNFSLVLSDSVRRPGIY